jgi:hypothetical protein
VLGPIGCCTHLKKLPGVCSIMVDPHNEWNWHLIRCIHPFTFPLIRGLLSSEDRNLDNEDQ